MKQLALDIRLAEHAVFDTYYPGANALVLDGLQRLVAGEGAAVMWLWGGAGSGKTHLLQASVAAAHARALRTAYLPLGELGALPPAVLDGFGGYDLVALDDLGAVAGQADWERALLGLYEQLVPAGCRLLVAGEAPPAQLGLGLPDLSSRLTAGGVFRLEQLSDADCLQALQRRAKWRGFSLPQDTGQYLLTRVDRNVAGLFHMLDRLDQAALAAQKRLTIPFVRSVLDSAVD